MTSERNLAMAELYRSGATLQEVADHYGIARQRVHQILAKQGFARDHGGQVIALKQREEDVLRARDAKYQARYGCTFEQWRWLVRIGRRMRSAGKSYHQTPGGAFSLQRDNAAKRGIEWKLTLWQWWSIWAESGKWEERGRGSDGYVMCRKGDTGPYAVGNVFIGSAVQNVQEAFNRAPKHGVVRVGDRFAAVVIVGYFDTAQEAHAAFLSAAGHPVSEAA